MCACVVLCVRKRVCDRVCVSKRERDKEKEREREIMCVCVCVCEREREIVCLWV